MMSIVGPFIAMASHLIRASTLKDIVGIIKLISVY